MFCGHAASALLLFSSFKHVPLWALVVAAALPDLIMPPLIFQGLEQIQLFPEEVGFLRFRLINAPFSHGLMGTCALALALFIVSLASKSKWALALALATLSHFACDFVVHDGDLHLGFESPPTHGLGLWRTAPGLATVLELAMLGSGFALQSASVSGLRWFCAVIAGMQIMVDVLGRLPMLSHPTPLMMVLTTAGGYAVFIRAASWVVAGKAAAHRN